MSAPEVLTGLTDEQAQAVRELAARAAEADGVEPLSEEGLLGLSRDDPERRHVLTMGGPVAIGYAWLDLAGKSGEIVVDPAHRRRGVGTALAVELRILSGVPLRDGELPNDNGARLWAHGDLAPAQAFAGQLGLRKMRELWLLRRDLSDPEDLAEPKPAPEGIETSTFRPGLDEAEWLEANAATFANHPEQGAWRASDLAERERSDWFDPTAFFLLRRAGKLVAFVWLKILDDDGEIYVLGVVPGEQSGGLGGYLVDLALQELVRRGVSRASLYVDADNYPAVGIYRNAGFEAATADGQYAYPA